MVSKGKVSPLNTLESNDQASRSVSDWSGNRWSHKKKSAHTYTTVWSLSSIEPHCMSLSGDTQQSSDQASVFESSDNRWSLKREVSLLDTQQSGDQASVSESSDNQKSLNRKLAH